MQYASIVDAYVWLELNKISLGHSLWQLDKHWYQMGPLQCDAPRQVARKGAQMGWSEIWVLKTLHGMIHGKYPKGALYLFPTTGDVADFTKARFNPLIDSNSAIKAFVKDTDSVNIKKVGTGFLYLRGARATANIEGKKKSSSKLKTVPVDRIVYDERDEMSEAMVELALERVSHSDVQEEMHLGTPTVPNYGVDKLYQQSDQRCWFIRCRACGHETCLELEFPDCIRLNKDGEYYRACVKCGKEIRPVDGEWRPLYPDRSKDLVGWWIGQLNSMYVKPGKIISLYNDPPNGNLSEVMNSKLGMAYEDAEAALTPNDIWECCGQDAMMMDDSGPCAMGVDIGKRLHVVIGKRPSSKRKKIIKVVTVSSFNDLHDLAQKYNVKCAVLDKYPETRKCRDFQESESYPVWLCGYQDGKKKGPTSWDWSIKEIAANRTEICDASHDLVKDVGALEFPRKCNEMQEYTKHMCNIFKTLEEDENTGDKYYTYKKRGDDHYRHATNYFMLASERIGVQSDRSVISRFFKRRQGRTAMTV